MTFFLFSIGSAAILFIGSLVVLNYGRDLGLRYLKKQHTDSMVGLNAIEGAVFALMGLLLAFTISGALQRFDERRQLIIQEATTTRTAYERLGLFERDIARDLRTKLKEYVRARIELYSLSRDFSLWRGTTIYSREQEDRILAFRHELWNAALEACSSGSNRISCTLALPALSNLFDVAGLRAAANERHPPQIIYVMLYGLGLGGSLLGGFGMAAAKSRSWVHMVIFAAALTFALFIVTNIEFPRLGFIRVDRFDHFLIEAYEQIR